MYKRVTLIICLIMLLFSLISCNPAYQEKNNSKLLTKLTTTCDSDKTKEEILSFLEQKTGKKFKIVQEYTTLTQPMSEELQQKIYALLGNKK